MDTQSLRCCLSMHTHTANEIEPVAWRRGALRNSFSLRTPLAQLPSGCGAWRAGWRYCPMEHHGAPGMERQVRGCIELEEG